MANDSLSALHILLSGLSNPDITERTSIIRRLIENFELPHLYKLLVATLEDEDSSIAFFAARVLALMFPLHSVSHLTKLLMSPDSDLRHSTCLILGELGTSVASSKLLEVAQNDEDPDVRFTAISVLKSCGEVDCIPVLNAIMKKDNAKTIDGRAISREAAEVAAFLNQKFTSHT